MKSPRKRMLLWVLAACAISIALISLTIARKGRVEHVTPVRRAILEAIYGLGKVKTSRHYEVKLGVYATVLQLHVQEGQKVSKGDALITFETGPFRAPFSGTVSEVNVFQGETAIPQATLMRVDDLSRRFVEVALEQQGALRVRPGMTAKMVFDTVRAVQYQGRVSSVFSREDEFLAHILLPELPESLLPGMTADVVIEVGTKIQALLVPLIAINNGQVVVERDGKRIKVPVEVGVVDGKMAEVTQGDLKDLDLLVVPRKKAAGQK